MRLANYRTGGGRTALVSEYSAQQKLAALEAASLFDVVVSNGESDELTALKPSPAGLLLAADKLNVAPSRCLVIGDRPDVDGQAAARAGMAFAQVRSFSSRWILLPQPHVPTPEAAPTHH